jgi:hypothetical protein
MVLYSVAMIEANCNAEPTFELLGSRESFRAGSFGPTWIASLLGDGMVNCIRRSTGRFDPSKKAKIHRQPLCVQLHRSLTRNLHRIPTLYLITFGLVGALVSSSCPTVRSSYF